MPNITITQPALIAAASTCVSTEKTRYYLNGVLIQAAPEGGAYIVATDGHRLSAGYDAGAAVEGGGEYIMSVERRDWPAFAKADTATIVDDRVQLDGPKASKSLVCTWVDASYPAWKRVLPSGDLGPTGVAFDAKYFATWVTVAKYLGHKFAPVRFYGEAADSPHVVRIAGEERWFGVLMPSRLPRGDAASTYPEWINPA